MAKLKKKACCGLVATCTDGVIWHWSVDGCDYSWCPAGQVRAYGHTPSQEKLILWCKSVDVAMAYTLGHHDAMKKLESIDVAANGAKEEPGSPA